MIDRCLNLSHSTVAFTPPSFRMYFSCSGEHGENRWTQTHASQHLNFKTVKTSKHFSTLCGRNVCFHSHCPPSDVYDGKKGPEAEHLHTDSSTPTTAKSWNETEDDCMNEHPFLSSSRGFTVIIQHHKCVWGGMRWAKLSRLTHIVLQESYRDPPAVSG